MRRIVFFVAAVILTLGTADPAPAQTVSLVGAWQLCNADGCSQRFAFQPNGTVIKQYVVLGTTVTAYGHYTRQGDMLGISWTRFSPKRVCRPNGSAGASKCKATAEPAAQGSIRFDGFNALVWTMGRQPLRLVRIAQ
ncbi:MAG: hypothetical protein JOZ30_08945 [Hyphomicrobiales bacterium]|nr:hypothetical protein [Hyphomicrobiales bacterium]